MSENVRHQKTAEEAWAEFKRHYMPVALAPSYHGKDCLGNGKHEVERQYDACDHYRECFPELV